MKYVRDFNTISKADIRIAGGKGASLGEMCQAGFPVPPGFVVLASAFERFLAESDLNQELDTIFHSVNQNEMRTVEKASEKIKMLILTAKIPEDIANEIKQECRKLDAAFVAVRSSATAEDGATAAWAGQLETYLNTTEDNLLGNVQRCWASLFTPRAIFYRYEKGMHGQKISVAVVVQKMVESEVSGIAFSVHPTTEDRNQMIIEAAFGLGEAIVSGQITPDSYVVEKTPRRIIDKNITIQQRALWRAANGGNEWRELSAEEGSKPALHDDQVFELADIILRIEQHYGSPQDIEWAYETRHFYVLQSRPITTLSVRNQQVGLSMESTDRLGRVDQYTLHWTQTDVTILMTDVMCSPDAYGIIDYVYLIENGIVRAYVTELGLKEFYDLGQILLDKKAVEKISRDAQATLKNIAQYECPDLNDGNCVKEWDRLIGLWEDFWRIYRYCDEFVQRPLEELLKKEFSADEITSFLNNAHDARLSDNAKYALEVLREMGQAKLDLHGKAELLIKREYTFAKFLGARYDISETQFFALRNGEIRDALSGKRVPPLEEMNLRLNGCAFVRQDKEYTCVHGSKFQDWKRRIESTEPKEIRGTVAYRGRVQGHVIKHLSWTGITEMPKGAILVTGMTNPQMVPFLKNAAAIVTDEGGLTCHAAIISRELKIPCIVGTKVATRLLQNGDFVNVDALRGHVTVTNKA